MSLAASKTRRIIEQTMVEKWMEVGGLGWREGVTKSDYREGRVSPSSWQMGTNFYIGDLNPLRLLRIRIPSLTLTDVNHGRSPNADDSDFPVYSGRYAKPTPDLQTAEANTKPLDDDDDFDESAIPAFSHPTMRPSTPPLNKGKSRAPEQLALPTGSSPSNQLSGNIGTPIPGTSRGPRRNFGGIQVESR